MCQQLLCLGDAADWRYLVDNLSWVPVRAGVRARVENKCLSEDATGSSSMLALSACHSKSAHVLSLDLVP